MNNSINLPKPGKSSLSPVRSSIQHQQNENRDAETSAKMMMANLNASVESKRNMLTKLYDEMKKQQMPEKQTNDNEILKQVHFEDEEIETEDKIVNVPIFNTTYKVQTSNSSLVKPVPLTSIGNQNPKSTSTNLKAKTKSPTKSPTSRTPVKQPNMNSTKTTSASPAKNKIAKDNDLVVKPKYPLTLQQKRQKQQEEKAREKRQLDLLRKNVILRKYAYIWLRRFFYTNKYSLFQFDKLNNNFTKFKFTLPSQAILFYENKLSNDCLRTWHENIRFQRNEWRANVKANCHFKYVILNKLWREWRTFVVIQKEETKNEKIADYFHGQKLKRKYLEGWREELEETARKKAQLEKAKQLRDFEILKECYKLWYIKYTRRHIELRSEKIADEQYRYVQLSKVFSLWYGKFKNESDDRRKIRIADQHYKDGLIKKCFHSMKIYRLYRRKKQIQKLKLQEYYESQLVYRVYHIWLEKYEIKKKMMDMENLIDKFRETHLVARVFQYWNNEYKYRIGLRVREIKMKKFHEKKLKRKTFDALKSNYIDAKNKQLDEIKAENFDLKWVKKIYFAKWFDRLEEKNEINKLHLMYKANIFYETNLQQKCLKEWKIFVLETRDLNSKIDLAESHYSNVIAKRYFHAMKLYVDITKVKKENYIKAIEFERYNTCYKILTTWAHKYELSIETQMNTRIAILHHESKVKTNIYKKWNLKLKELIKDQLNEKLALVNYRRILLKSSFNSWKSQSNQTKKEYLHENLAIKHDFKRQCRPVFNNWKLYRENSLAIKQKCDQITHLYHLKISRVVFKSWRDQTKQFKELNLQIKKMYEQKQYQRLKDCFNIWLRQARQSREEKLNEKLAVTFYLKHLMIKVVREWRAYSFYRIAKRDHENIMIEKFNQIKTSLILKKVYFIWSKKTKNLVQLNLKFKKAIEFCDEKRKRKAYSAWRIYMQHCWHKNYLNNQAVCFHEMRLKTEFYYKWAQKFQIELEQREKNQQALIYWSISIQKAFFQLWLGWYKMRKEKRQRYKMAIERRQIDILKVCGRNFLKFSTDSILRRKKATKELKEIYFQNSIELEFKYFHVWKSKCKILNRPKTSDLTTTRLVEEKTIQVKPTLAKCEQFEIEYAPIKCDKLSKIRPEPRKPLFLNDSVDFAFGLEASKPTVKTSLGNNEFSPQQPALLLPPSAFTKPIYNYNYQIIPEVTVESPKIVYEIKNYSVADLASNNQSIKDGDITSRTVMSDKPNKTKPNNHSEEQLELVELKKRLEIISLKTEKLKRLREQEKMLIKCIESTEINKTSICGTIYDEKDQVTAEIDELSRFLRNEKLQVSQLAKKYKLLT